MSPANTLDPERGRQAAGEVRGDLATQAVAGVAMPRSGYQQLMRAVEQHGSRAYLRNFPSDQLRDFGDDLDEMRGAPAADCVPLLFAIPAVAASLDLIDSRNRADLVSRLREFTSDVIDWVCPELRPTSQAATHGFTTADRSTGGQHRNRPPSASSSKR